MKISHIATAAAVPAVIAGAAISFGVAGHASSGHTSAGHPAAGSKRPAASPAADTTAHASRVKASSSRATGKLDAASTKDAALWITVKPGQTLSGIAAAHHISWQALYATPPNVGRLHHDPDVLVAGERLRIPSDPRLRQAQFRVRYAASLRRSTPASQVPAAAPSGGSNASDAYSTAGESSFEQCVAWRESSDTPTDPDGLFGILPSTWQSLGYSGTAGEASVAVQDQAFAKLYAEDGAAPWAPYDGC